MVLSSAAETLFEDFFAGSYTETFYHVTLNLSPAVIPPVE